MRKLPGKGFTLIELMITIAIIAVIAAVGITVYSGVQKGARDAKRIEDVNSIADSLEANYNTNNKYISPAVGMFSAGTFPQDAINTKSVVTDAKCPSVCIYCGRVAPTPYSAGATACLNADNEYSTLAITDTNQNWQICANLEAKTVNGKTFYCRRNRQ